MPLSGAMHAASHASSSITHDVDCDSLFGSPPPSPGGIGRSLSPLALPGAAGSAQNVGTLALPGSHLVAEASVHPSASLALGINDCATVIEPSPWLRIAGSLTAQSLHTRPSSASSAPTRTPASRFSPAPRQSNKGKEKARSTVYTPRVAAPPIPIPPPNEQVPPNFLRNQQALLGVAGLVSGVNPSQLAPQPGTSATNPIVVHDINEDGQPRSIGRRPLASTALPPPIPSASGPELLQTLARQGSVIPLVESLVRLLTNTTFVPVPSKLPGRTGWERTNPADPPPPKRRKLNTVPAGASDWDVPYPFQDGQGPAGYQETWAKDRARRLLGDLIGLIQNAAKKAAMKGYLQEQERARKRRWIEERGWQGRVGGHYRERTAFYGLGDHLLQTRAQSMAPSVGACAPASDAASNGCTEVDAGGSRQTMSEPPSQPPQPVTPTSINHWLASVLAEASQVQEQSQSAQSPLHQGATSGTSVQALAPRPADGEEKQQQHFDEWFALLQSIPPADPDDPSLLPDIGNVLDEIAASVPLQSSSSTFGDGLDVGGADPIPDFLIDPTLFDMPTFPIASTPSEPQVQPPSAPSPAATTSSAQPAVSIPSGPSLDYLSLVVPGLSATPSLSGSPLASTASLDVEPSPATPEWMWTIGEPSAVNGGDDPQELDVTLAMSDCDLAVEGVNVEAEDLHAFQKVLEQASVPFSLGTNDDVHTASDNDRGRGNTAMDVDGATLPAVALHSMQDAHDLQVPYIASPLVGPRMETSRNPEDLLQSSRSEHGSFSNGSQAPCLQAITQPASVQSQVLPQSSYDAPPDHHPGSQDTRNQSMAGLIAGPSRLPTSVSPPAATALPLDALSSLLALASAPGSRSASAGKITRADTLKQAKNLKKDLERARERARVELWEATVEGACLVGLGREVAKDAQK